jgi:hypothetical protein
MLAYGESVVNARSAGKNRDMVKWMNDNPGKRLPLFEQRNVSVAGVGTYGV